MNAVNEQSDFSEDQLFLRKRFPSGITKISKISWQRGGGFGVVDEKGEFEKVPYKMELDDIFGAFPEQKFMKQEFLYDGSGPVFGSGGPWISVSSVVVPHNFDALISSHQDKGDQVLFVDRDAPTVIAGAQRLFSEHVEGFFVSGKRAIREQTKKAIAGIEPGMTKKTLNHRRKSLETGQIPHHSEEVGSLVPYSTEVDVVQVADFKVLPFSEFRIRYESILTSETKGGEDGERV